MRVLSVPARHPYVQAVTPDGVSSVRPDRVTDWEHDPALQPESLVAMIGELDLAHLHFGYDHWDPVTARQWVVGLHAAAVPLVVTVHDLRNPHHPRRNTHDAVLATLVDHAAVVTTLTPGAAQELWRRYGRVAQVIGHPTLVEPARSEDVATEPGLVGIALKSLRGNVIDPMAIVRAAAAGAADAGGRLRVDVHPEVMQDERLVGLAELGGVDSGGVESGGVEVAVHPRFDDLELERYIRRLQVSVLPYRWGTHSGWLELCRDLGTRVVAPSGGYYAEQWAEVVGYGNDEFAGFDPDTLRAAVAEAVRRPVMTPAAREVRLAQAEAVRASHAELYARALGR